MKSNIFSLFFSKDTLSHFSSTYFAQETNKSVEYRDSNNDHTRNLKLDIIFKFSSNI